MTNNINTALAGGGLTVPNWVYGAILAGLVFAVIVGGIKSIGRVAGNLVPAMALVYIISCIIILSLNLEYIPTPSA